MIKPFIKQTNSKTRAAIFMSGGGSNAEKILTAVNSSLTIAVIVTDRPKTSRAYELGRIYDVDVVAVDIREFYRDRGQNRVSIMTTEGRTIREEWTDEVRRRIADYSVVFGIFAGFVPLCNLTRDFPCLNVHPGDLTYELNGVRHLVGLHTVPIERAILRNLDYMRSSVIVAEPYDGKGENMDAGHVLGISPKVSIDLMGHTLEELKAVATQRPKKRPVKGYRDVLESVAMHNQETLKAGGDWVVLPPVVQAFADGRFALDEHDCLRFLKNDDWLSVATVEFDEVNENPQLLEN